MTIARVCSSKDNITVREFDRGGKSMSLIIRLLARLGNDHKDRGNRDFNDYGYALYQALEYNLKYLKGDDFGYERNPQVQPIDKAIMRNFYYF